MMVTGKLAPELADFLEREKKLWRNSVCPNESARLLRLLPILKEGLSVGKSFLTLLKRFMIHVDHGEGGKQPPVNQRQRNRCPGWHRIGFTSTDVC